MNLIIVQTCLCVILFCVIPVPADESTEKLPIFCYFQADSIYRHSNQKSVISQLPIDICTHIIYASAGIDRAEVSILDDWRDVKIDAKGGFKKVVELKEKNQSLKVLIALGGDSYDNSEKYSHVARSNESRLIFAKSVAKFLRHHGFDGVEIAWPQPNSTDFVNFHLLLKDIRAAIGGNKLLTVLVPRKDPKSMSTGHNVREIVNSVNFINVMTYDLRGPQNTFVDNHVLLRSRANQTNYFKQRTVENVMKSWLHGGADKTKLLMGFAFYGRSFTLRYANEYHINAPLGGPGDETSESGSPGTLYHYEICDRIKNQGWTEYWDNVGKVPYAVKGNQWVGYDNERGIQEKVRLLKKMGYGGAVIRDIDMDDAAGTNCTGRPYPLARALRDALWDIDDGLKGHDASDMVTLRVQAELIQGSADSTGSVSSSPYTHCPSSGEYLPHETYCSKFCHTGVDAEQVGEKCGLYFTGLYAKKSES